MWSVCPFTLFSRCNTIPDVVRASKFHECNFVLRHQKSISLCRLALLCDTYIYIYIYMCVCVCVCVYIYPSWNIWNNRFRNIFYLLIMYFFSLRSSLWECAKHRQSRLEHFSSDIIIIIIIIKVGCYTDFYDHLSHHPFLLSIGKFSRWQPVSVLSWWMELFANTGVFICRSSWENVAYELQQNSACLVNLVRAICEMGGKRPYSCFFCWILRPARRILV